MPALMMLWVRLFISLDDMLRRAELVSELILPPEIVLLTKALDAETMLLDVIAENTQLSHVTFELLISPVKLESFAKIVASIGSSPMK